MSIRAFWAPSLSDVASPAVLFAVVVDALHAGGTSGLALLEPLGCRLVGCRSVSAIRSGLDPIAIAVVAGRSAE